MASRPDLDDEILLKAAAGRLVGVNGIFELDMDTDRWLWPETDDGEQWSPQMVINAVAAALDGRPFPSSRYQGDDEVPVDTGVHEPVSVANGNVAPGLVEGLTRLGDEYGPTGVAEIAAEMAGTRLL